MELGPPRLVHAVDRPGPAVLGEVRRDRRVPVLRVDDQRVGSPRGADLGLDRRQDRRRAGHGEAACRIGEVVLDVDHDEGRPEVVARLAGRGRGCSSRPSYRRREATQGTDETSGLPSDRELPHEYHGRVHARGEPRRRHRRRRRRHRRARPAQAFRHRTGRERRRLRRPQGRDLRPARAQRRRQDHDDRDARGPPARRRRPAARARPGPCPPGAPAQGAHRCAAPDRGPLPAADRGRDPGALRLVLPACPAGAAAAGRPRPWREEGRAIQDAVRRPAAAPVGRPGDGQRPRARLPGRADDRPRPCRPPRPVGPHRRHAPAGQDGAHDDALHGRGGDPLRPAGDHGPRQAAGHGHRDRARRPPLQGARRPLRYDRPPHRRPVERPGRRHPRGAGRAGERSSTRPMCRPRSARC